MPGCCIFDRSGELPLEQVAELAEVAGVSFSDEPPSPANAYHAAHADLIMRSFRELTGRELFDAEVSASEAARRLYESKVVVMSHDTATDPVFNYANLAAQRLFAMDWTTFVRTPSRLSAEPMARDERARLLAEVTQHGFIDNYHGVRISRNGERFRIEQATVWNLFDQAGRAAGQAAAFSQWQSLAVAKD